MPNYSELADRLVVEIEEALELSQGHGFEIQLSDLRYATRKGMRCIVEAMHALGYVAEDGLKIEDDHGRYVLSTVFSQPETPYYVECLVGGYRLGRENGEETLILSECEMDPIYAGKLLFKVRAE